MSWHIRFVRIIGLVIALGFAAGAPAQYAYPSGAGYPAAASSTPHAAHINPIQAGGSIANRPGIGQSHAGIGSNAQDNGALGSSGYKYGQSGQNLTTPNGSAIGQQTVTGPNGQQIGQQTGGKYGSYGQQKGAGYGYGSSYNNGAGSLTQSGSAPGMANGNTPHFNNGGMVGAADQPSDAPSKPTGKSNQGGDANGSSYGEALNALNDDWGHPANGKDSQGNTWSDGKLVNGYDENGVKYHDGKPVQGGAVPKYGGNGDPSDMPNYGGGEVVNGTGNVVHPGQPGGQDTGGGQGQDAGNSGSGSNKNATGQYATVNTPYAGQDSPVKPKDQGVLNQGAIQKGNIDPNPVQGSNGGH